MTQPIKAYVPCCSECGEPALIIPTELDTTTGEIIIVWDRDACCTNCGDDSIVFEHPDTKYVEIDATDKPLLAALFPIEK